MPSIYTRSGDSGETGLLFGGRISKADPRAEAYGSTDHAASAIGLARALSADERSKSILLDAQRDIFMISAELATDLSNRQLMLDTFRTVSNEQVERLESTIDALKAEVELPPKFIIPGASVASAAMDVARAQVREAERRVVTLKERGLLPNESVLMYLNRLSDMLFVLARYEDRYLPFDIITGQPPKSDSQ